MYLGGYHAEVYEKSGRSRWSTDRKNRGGQGNRMQNLSAKRHYYDALSRLFGTPPRGFNGSVLQSDWIDTPLGLMLAIANDQALLLLEFADRHILEREVERLRSRTRAVIVPGSNSVIESIAQDLQSYFAAGGHRFKTPVELIGSTFQTLVWEELQRIPAGTVRSYAQQARCIGSPQAVRAVARANGANQLAIIVPCHRVIGSNGALTGYGGGLPRKQWLLEHEGAMHV